MTEVQAWLEGVSYVCWTVVWISLLVFTYNCYAKFVELVNKPITEDECKKYILAKEKVTRFQSGVEE